MTALRDAIAVYRTRRIRLPVLRAAHAHHDPTGASSNDARTRLVAALSVLEAEGVITMPKTLKLYERHISPPLPMWVERPPVSRAPPTPAPARVWRPQLAQAGALASSPAEQHVVLAVDKFLREGGTDRPVVPHRERSLELFCHEKRLDALMRTRLFTTGALTLDLLRCYLAPLPLTAQHTGNPGPYPQLLIVENHATYASALTLARARAASGRPALAVGYGSGNQLPASIAGASQLEPPPLDIAYFGDLDRGGLSTARAAAAAASAAGLPKLRPALPLYSALLTFGTTDKTSGAVPMKAEEAAVLAEWLGQPDVAAAACLLLMSGHRLAQEAVGYERLSTIPTWC